MNAFGALVRIRRGAGTTKLAVRWDGGSRRPCRLRVAGVTLRRISIKHDQTVALAPGTDTVTVHPTPRCSGRFGSADTVTAFRLTS